MDASCSSASNRSIIIYYKFNKMKEKVTPVVVDFQYDFCLLGAPLYVPGSDKAVAIGESIKLTPTDGLGISNSDLDQIGAESYNDVDRVLQTLVCPASPAQNRQNVSFRYYALIDAQPGSISVGTGNDRGGEEDEVEAIGWIPLDSIDKYQWAFDHDKIIREFAEWMHLEDGDLDMEDIDLDPV